MNKKIKVLLFLLSCFVGLSFTSCERYPIRDLNGIPATVDSWPYPWYIYDDEINTKGLFAPVMWVGSDEADELDFDYNHSTYRGRACIKFDWHPKNGNTWCGFGLATTEEPNNPHSAKDMSTSGYTKLEFYIKGTLLAGATVTVNIPRTDYNGESKSPTDSVTISTLSPDTWTKKTINLTGARTKENWNTQKFYISISISGTGTNGGTIYLDDIKFVKD